MDESRSNDVHWERGRVEADIKGIVSDVLEIPLEELNCDAHFVDELGVDSLLALEVLSEMEKRFGIEVPEEDLIQFTTVNKVIQVACDKLGVVAGLGSSQ